MTLVSSSTLTYIIKKNLTETFVPNNNREAGNDNSLSGRATSFIFKLHLEN